MKKFITSIIAITFTVLLCVSCGSSKKGCGLTADASVIESTTIENIVVAQAK